jgi:hypothetical protein
MMETIRTSETSVYSNDTTRRNIPEGSYTRRRENLKCRMLLNKLRNHQHNISVLTTRPTNTRPSEGVWSLFVHLSNTDGCVSLKGASRYSKHANSRCFLFLLQSDLYDGSGNKFASKLHLDRGFLVEKLVKHEQNYGSANFISIEGHLTFIREAPCSKLRLGQATLTD